MDRRGFLKIAAAAAVLAGACTAEGQEAGKIRALILTGSNNHKWQQTTPALKSLYEESGRFSVDVTEEPNKCDAAMLAKYDVLVDNYNAWPAVTGHQWGATAEKAIVDFVRGGKGFVVFHSASAAFQDWPEFQEMAGATWKLNVTNHNHIGPFKVVIKDPNHPIAKGMKDFWTTDELWYNMETRPNIKVLCEAFSKKELAEKGKESGSGKNEPMIIWTEFGKGRCFYNIMGDNVKSMENVGFQTLMLRGTEWAATGNVTIPIPANWPSEQPAEKNKE
jgi:type 1 glutamine amidotransferase